MERRIEMSTCPQCHATAIKGAVSCGNCGAMLNSQTTLNSASVWPNTISSNDMSARLEKALRRSEQLGYAAAGLGAAIVVALLVIYFL